jgi:hypothetical protein
VESFSFELKLVSDIDRIAKRDIAPLKKLEEQAEKTKTSLSKGFAGQWEKIGYAAARSSQRQQNAFANSWTKIGGAAERSAQKQQAAFANSWSKIGMAADRAQKRQLAHHEKLEKAAERLKEKHAFMTGVKEAVGFEKLASAAFVGSVMAEAFIEAAHKAVEVLTEGIKFAFEAGGKHEQTRLSYRLIMGSERGKEAMEDQERFSDRAQYVGGEIAQQMRPLYNAKMDPKAARQAYATAGDIQAKLGGNIGEYIDMMARIKNKGGVSEKMLLGLGIDTQSFYASVAKATGTKGKVGTSAIEAAKKKASEEKINPQILLNAITESVNKQQGGPAGTGLELQSKTMSGRLHKLSMLPEMYLEKLDETPAWNAISEKFGELFERLNPEGADGQRVMESITKAFSKIEGLVDSALKPESIDAFVAGIGKAVDAAGALVSTLREAIDLINGETISKKLFQGDEGDKKLADIEFKKKELRMGTFSDIEHKQRENEIQTLVHSLSPSEAADYDKKYGKPYAPMPDFGPQPAQPGNAKVIKIDLHPGAVVVHAAPGEDPDHTHRKAGESVRRHVQAAVERAAQEGGG